jgi:uncharacterized membrane protein
VLIVYLLDFAAYIIGITALIGVIIAYIKAPDANPLLRSHYQFQIRTFWIGLLYLVVGTVLALLGMGFVAFIGFAILFWVVKLVASAQRQGRAYAQRQQADPKSGLLDVWMNS